MKTQSVLLPTLATALALSLIAPSQSKPNAHATSPGKPAHVKTASAPMYECPICHHKASASLAKKLHYICPADNGKLALIKTARLPKAQ